MPAASIRIIGGQSAGLASQVSIVAGVSTNARGGILGTTSGVGELGSGSIDVRTTGVGSEEVSGALLLQSGSSFNGDSGDISVSVGDSISATESGSIYVLGGPSSGEGRSGSIVFNIGDARHGGSISLSSGSSENVLGAPIEIIGGISATNFGGSVNVLSGISDSSASGTISVITKAAPATGDINARTADTMSSIAAGSVFVNVGASAQSFGGNIDISVGQSADMGGSVSISSGASTTEADGGSISLRSGISASRASGALSVSSGAGGISSGDLTVQQVSHLRHQALSMYLVLQGQEAAGAL
jgi:hypothetical protein